MNSYKSLSDFHLLFTIWSILNVQINPFWLKPILFSKISQHRICFNRHFSFPITDFNSIHRNSKVFQFFKSFKFFTKRKENKRILLFFFRRRSCFSWWKKNGCLLAWVEFETIKISRDRSSTNSFSLHINYRKPQVERRQWKKSILWKSLTKWSHNLNCQKFGFSRLFGGILNFWAFVQLY